MPDLKTVLNILQKKRWLLTLAAALLIIGVAALIGFCFRMPDQLAGQTTTEWPHDEYDLSEVPSVAFERGNSLVAGTAGPFRIINPLFSTAEGENDAASLIFESLVLIDETGDPEGLLASSWTYEPETHQIIFILRDDHTFRDGRVLNANDVVFTYQCLLAASYDGPMQGRFDSITAISRGQSASEVIFTLNSSVVQPDFRLFTVGILKSDYYQLSLDKVYEMADITLVPEGTGAYALQDMNETEIFLSLRSGYGSLIKTIAIRKVDSADKYALLQTGELDIVRNTWDLRMQSRADTLPAYHLTRFSTSIESYFLVNPELQTSNIIQLPSQRLAVLLTAAGRELSSLQINALESLAGRRLQLYYFAGLDDNIMKENRLKAERIINRLVAAGLSVEAAALDWPEMAARANSGDYDIILLPVTANNRLPAKTEIMNEDIQPGTSAIIAEYRHEVYIVSKRLLQVGINPASHPFAALAGSWTDHLENVMILN
ncbi:MAG TPA: hypothetical protein DCM45_00550, partial [Clostridiales bacterium]|nr:hypothetical protein [Clostridiales bacterium]